MKLYILCVISYTFLFIFIKLILFGFITEVGYLKVFISAMNLFYFIPFLLQMKYCLLWENKPSSRFVYLPKPRVKRERERE